jgi:hypothetical protein
VVDYSKIIIGMKQGLWSRTLDELEGWINKTHDPHNKHIKLENLDLNFLSIYISVCWGVGGGGGGGRKISIFNKLNNDL